MVLENPTGFHLLSWADVTVYVDGFINQHFDALALTHILKGCKVALGTVVVEELVYTCV